MKSINPASGWKTPENRHCVCKYYALLLMLKYREGYHWIGSAVLFSWPDSSLVPLRLCVQLDGSHSQQIKQRARGRLVIYVPEIDLEHKEVVPCPDYPWLLRVQLLGLRIPLLGDIHVPVNSLALLLGFWSVFSLFSSYTWCPSLKGTIMREVLHHLNPSAWSQVSL